MQGRLVDERLRSARGTLYLTVLMGLSLWTCGMVARVSFVELFNIPAPTAQSLLEYLGSATDPLSWTRPALEASVARTTKAWAIAVLAGIATFATGIALLSVTLRRRRESGGHGTAKWAIRKDCVEAGLLEGTHTPTSLIIGGWENPGAREGEEPEFLVYSGGLSVMSFAPSGSAKTVSLVIPNLLSYESSALVMDPKFELWQKTAGYRQQELGHKVMYHDPSRMDPGSVRFNSLEEIDIETNACVKEAQLQAEYLIPSSSEKTENKSHFEQAARSLLVGVILFELTRARIEGRRAPSIANLLSSVTNPDRTIREYLLDLTDFDTGPASVSRVVREIATEQLNREEREFNAVLSSLITPLTKFRDPILAAATQRSDFRLLDLVNDEQPVTLYLIARPSDRDRLKHYYGMFINILLRKLTEETGGHGNMRRELLLMLEEFSSLPALPVVKQLMDVMRGYGIKAMFILQDVESLYELYGENETFTSNTQVKIAYTPNKPRTAKLLSDMVGTTTITEETSGSSSKPMGIVPSSQSRNQSVHARALLTPDEIRRMSIAKVDAQQQMIKAGTALIDVAGMPPIKAVQTPYFFNQELLRRSNIRPPESSDTLPGEPETDARMPESVA